VTLAAPREVYRMGLSHLWKRVGLGLGDAMLDLWGWWSGSYVDGVDRDRDGQISTEDK
jgi:hypothetical protein